MNSSITIYSPNGDTIYTMPAIFENCTEKYTLMQEDYIELHFNLLEPVFFEIGCWAMWNGKKYYVTEFQQPSYDASTGGYGYELKLNAYYRAWGLKLYKYASLSVNGDKSYASLNDNEDKSSVALRELTFSLTANLRTHAETIVRCLNLDGFRWYNESDRKEEEFYADLWKSNNEEEVDFKEVKTLTYDSVNYIDALSQIAEEWSTEWWVQDNILYFGKCQDNTIDAVDFEQGVNVETIDGSKSQSDYATRIYAFGSDKNLPKYYGKNLVFQFKDFVNKYDKDYLDYDKALYTSYFEDKYKLEWNKLFNFDKSIRYTPTANGYDTEWVEDKITSCEVTIQAGVYELTKYSNDNYFSIYKLVKNDKNQVAYKDKFKINCQFDESQLSYARQTAEIHVCLVGDGGTTINLGNYGGEDKIVNSVLAHGIVTLYYIGSSGESGDPFVNLPKFEITKETNVHIEIYAAAKEPFDLGFKVSVGSGYQLWEKYEYYAYNLTIVPKSGHLNNKELNVVLKKQSIALKDEESKNDPNLYGFVVPKGYGDELCGQTFKIKNILIYKLPSWYFEEEKDLQNASTIKAFSEKRLSLPAPYYVDAEESVPFGSIIEKTLTYDDIYPRTETFITDVKTHSEYVKDENNEQTTLKYTDYYIKQDKFAFNNDYKLENAENLQIKFTTGALAGLTFDCLYDDSNFPSELLNKAYFKIIRQQMDGGMWLPNDAMHPALADSANGKEEADKFILIGWDSSRIEDLNLIKLAEDELLKKVEKEIQKMNVDPTTYECTMFSDVTYGRAEETLITDDNGVPITDDRGVLIRTDDSPHGLDASNEVTYKIGQRVRLRSKALFKDGERMSRIIGYEKKMDIPWDSPKYQVGEKAIYSTIGAIKSKIKSLEKNKQSKKK